MDPRQTTITTTTDGKENEKTRARGEDDEKASKENGKRPKMRGGGQLTTLTQFVDTTTDLPRLLRANFPASDSE